MFSKTFVVAFDEEVGNTGLKPAWVRESNAGEGSLIAHDMFEHAARPRFGASEEEFMAIGAAYRIRGENGFFRRGWADNQTQDVLANDVHTILIDLSRHEQSTFMAKPRNTYKLKDEEAEFVCQASARKGIQKAIAEWRNDYDDQGDLVDASDNRVVMEALAGNYTFSELQRMVTGWLRIGYMNVQRRFPEVDLYNLAYLYKSIGESADQAIDSAELGDKVRVTVDLKRFRFTVKNLARSYDR